MSDRRTHTAGVGHSGRWALGGDMAIFNSPGASAARYALAITQPCNAGLFYASTGVTMAFIELRANESRGGRRRGRLADTTVSTMALHKSGNRDGVPTYQLSIRLAQDLVKQMRWQIGDRVKVLVDDETPHKLLLQRVTSGGWALSYAGGKTQTVKKYRVQITTYTGINVAPGDRYACNGFTEEHGGAVLQFAQRHALALM